MTLPTQAIATRGFLKSYNRLDPRTQKLVDRKLEQLVANPACPSLQVHRLRQVAAANVMNCYISGNKRLIYQCGDGKIYLWDVGEHGIIDRVHLRGFQHRQQKSR